MLGNLEMVQGILAKKQKEREEGRKKDETVAPSSLCLSLSLHPSVNVIAYS